MTQNTSAYQKLVYVAYGFFILLGLVWLVTFFVNDHKFNVQAFIVILVFGIQAYFKNKMANLIIGILCLFFSIFMLLTVIDTFALAHQPLAYAILSSLSATSIVFSGILIFSYKKLLLK